MGSLLASSPQATSNTTARPHTARKALVEKQLGAALRNVSGANGKGTVVGTRSKIEDYRPRSNGSPDVPAHAVSGHPVVLPAPTRHWNSPCRPSAPSAGVVVPKALMAWPPLLDALRLRLLGLPTFAPTAVVFRIGPGQAGSFLLSWLFRPSPSL